MTIDFNNFITFTKATIDIGRRIRDDTANRYLRFFLFTTNNS
jgi:hypothetical protein